MESLSVEWYIPGKLNVESHTPSIPSENRKEVAIQTATGQDLPLVLPQHTSTCVTTREETYATLDGVDTDVLKTGPNVGQFTENRADAVQAVKDFSPLCAAYALKDYNGKGKHPIGYCPIGQCNQHPCILGMMEGRQIKGLIMAELDNLGAGDPDPLHHRMAARQGGEVS